MNSTNTQIRFLIRVWAVMGLGLFSATFNLWTPQTAFPQIPFFSWLIECPSWVDWCLLILMGLGLVTCLVKPKSYFLCFGCVLFVAASIASVLLNQHRLQPWTYHLLIFGSLFGLAANQKPFPLLKLLRWVVLSIYIYSSLSKFDYQFVHTIGDQMLEVLAGFAGLETANWSKDLKAGLVLLFPLGELMVGIALAFSRSIFMRWLSIGSAVGLHLALLLILGPLGLDHQPGVLVWNLFFILQAILVFGWAPAAEAQVLKDDMAFSSIRTTLAIAIVWLVILFPTTQWAGICDHWPAWQVYSPCSSRATLVNERSFSEWSLEELSVPVYPQARFQLGVAQAVIEKQNLQRGFQVELMSQSNRITGKRDSKSMTAADQIKMVTGKFWLNTKARKIWLQE